MKSQWNRTIVVAALLVAAPATAWMHTQSDPHPSAEVMGTIVDLRVTVEQMDAGDDGRPPGESIRVWPTAEYLVDGKTHRRMLSPTQVPGVASTQSEHLRQFLLGSTVSVSYDPRQPGNAPALPWHRWITWCLTIVCAVGVFFVVWPLLEHWATQLDGGKVVRTGRVLEAKEFRQGATDLSDHPSRPHN